jgi:hypothetical protein
MKDGKAPMKKKVNKANKQERKEAVAADESMTIQRMIEQIQDRIKNEPGFGDELRTLAIKAMYGGIQSDDWKAYMGFFASSPPQLMRLTTFDGDQFPYVRQARCYLVANAMCLPGTDTTLQNGIGDILDVTLP